MMISAYNLEPYSDAYLDNVLADLARHGAAGVVYTDLGQSSAGLKARGYTKGAVALNRGIFQRAKTAGASIWLQMRVYGNQLQVAGGPPRNVTAEEILSSPAAADAFKDRVRQEFSAYNDAFAGACRVILFEEAGIYHSADSGGLFWSSSRQALGKPSQAWDQMFADRMTRIFAMAAGTIKAINPNCQVGAHLGHSTVNDEPVLAAALSRMNGPKPDFIFYDFYEKSQKSYDNFARLLDRRARFIQQDLGENAIYLAQLHTMNDFQNGGGRTPSREELDLTMNLAKRLGFVAIGYYSKNALPTADYSNDPMDPNAVGQATVYESSKDRWDYGLLQVSELGGLEVGGLFDLVTHAPVGARLSLKNARTGRWDFVGETEPDMGQNTGGFTVFRDLNRNAYITADRRILARADSIGGRGVELWATPSQPDSRFQTVSELTHALGAGGAPPGALAAGAGVGGAEVVLKAH